MGSAYRLEPSGTQFDGPVAITFRTDALQASSESLGVSYQDSAGYWVPVLSVLRNTSAHLITVAADHFSDWALVLADPTQDLAGTFVVNSTLNSDTPFTALGNVSLSYVGEDSVERVFLASGTATLQPFAYSGAACIPMDSYTHTLPTNVAEAFIDPPAFSWGASALWSTACGPSTDVIEMVFDTAGISHIGCSRGYTAGAPDPVTSADVISGDYTIDCASTGAGKLEASYTFQRCGAACSSTNSCVTASSVTCSSSGPSCAATSLAAVGTACTANGQPGVCNSTGTCAPCSQGAPCISADPCASTATVECGSGASVCAGLTYKATGTPCTDAGGAPGVCNGTAGGCVLCVQGALCSPSGPCATEASVDCSSGAPVCRDGASKPAGTPCTDAGGTAGVCDGTGSRCVQCAQGGTCTSSNPCVQSATTDCSSGAAVCIGGPGLAAGSPCSSGGNTGTCSGPPANACTACIQGAACTPSGACIASAGWDCSTGTPVCVDDTPRSAGEACTTSTGAAGVCSGPPGNACTLCTAGASCASNNPCAATATIDCSTGVPVCTNKSIQPAGTPCTAATGGPGVCLGSAAVCTACSAGPCLSTNPCATSAVIACGSGLPVCTDATFAADATVCDSNTGSVCLGGSCTLCQAGASCGPGVLCHIGTLSCGNAVAFPPVAPSCLDTGISNCPAGLTCNVASGVCQ